MGSESLPAPGKWKQRTGREGDLGRTVRDPGWDAPNEDQNEKERFAAPEITPSSKRRGKDRGGRISGDEQDGTIGNFGD